MPPYLTKSRYTRGLNCPRALWLTVNRPELESRPSAAQLARFESGHAVGRLAQDLFPGGVEPTFDAGGLMGLVERTRAEIERGTTTIYEATFHHDNVFVRVDILHHGADGWELHEVKSSTSVKEYHHDDLAIQYHVVAGAGLPVSRATLIHIDKNYVRKGSVEPVRLFTSGDLTKVTIEAQPGVRSNLERLNRLVRQEAEPDTAIGPHCFTPGECPFRDHCWSCVPTPSIFDLWPDGSTRALKLFSDGFALIKDLPDKRLSLPERRVRDCHLSGTPYVNREAIAGFLATLRYPLSFLDFETTAMVAVPLFDGTRPYQAVPFQYSLHVTLNPGDEPNHREFLHSGDDDPRPAFLERLLADLPHGGSIVSWNMTFERKILADLASALPARAAEIGAICARFVDLMDLFRKKEVYFPAFGGSASLKHVLPAVAPDLSYKELAVQDGGMASDTWLRLRTEPDAGTCHELGQSLRDYCRLDTLAMVRILCWLDQSR